jgi:hypothetical protein
VGALTHASAAGRRRAAHTHAARKKTDTGARTRLAAAAATKTHSASRKGLSLRRYSLHLGCRRDCCAAAAADLDGS